MGLALSVGLLAVLVWWAYDQSQKPGYRFDWMLISGYATAVVGLWLARGQGARFEDAVRRLADRDALRTTASGPRRALRGEEVEELIADVRRRAFVAGHRWGLPVALATAVIFAVVYTRIASPDTRITVLAIALATVTGYLVGRALGRLATYGFVRSPMFAGGREVRAVAGHPDAAAGLKPLGDFYLSQALMLLVPGAFLLAWALLLRLDEWQLFYGQWEKTYQGLLAFVIVLQILIFVAPMLATHVAMQEQKREELHEADGYAAQIEELREQLATKLTADDRAALKDQLQALIDRYNEVDSMPTWPVPRRIWHGFALQSVGLAAPLVTDFGRSLFGF